MALALWCSGVAGDGRPAQQLPSMPADVDTGYCTLVGLVTVRCGVSCGCAAVCGKEVLLKQPCGVS
jgi:hypothetical protein